MPARLTAALLTFAAASVEFGTTGEALALANPASVFCDQRGGRVETETAANGAVKGVCVLRDGTRIDEWAFFRNGHRTTH